MKKIIILFYFLSIISNTMNSQNTKDSKQMEFILDTEILGNDISKYDIFFIPVSRLEALELKIPLIYNYRYIGNEALFCGYKVYNLSLKVNDEKIVKVHFELEYDSKEILYDLFDKLGYPESGRMTPNVPRFKDSEGSKTDPSNHLYENYNALYWKTDENYHSISISNISTPQFYSLNNPNIWINFSIVERFLKYEKIESKDSLQIHKSVSFEKQKEIFKTLGYHYNNEIPTQKVISKMLGSMLEYPETLVDVYPEELLDEYFEALPFVRLYYFFGWTIWNNKERILTPFSNQCIWFDKSFLKVNKDYNDFMLRMSKITNGQIVISDIKISTISDNTKTVTFTVNGFDTEWKIDSENIFKTFIQRFSELTKKHDIKGKYTLFKYHENQFVLDFATEAEQKEFNIKTGLERSWLEN